MSKLPDKEIDTFLILDETASLTIDILSLALANVRKHRIGIVTTWQSYEQIVNTYGAAEAEAIRVNSYTQVYLTGQGINASQDLEKVLGRTEVVDQDGNKVIKPLMLAEEFRMLKNNEAIVVSGSRKPFKISMTPYYKQPFLNIKASLPPVICENSFFSDDYSRTQLYNEKG